MAVGDGHRPPLRDQQRGAASAPSVRLRARPRRRRRCRARPRERRPRAARPSPPPPRAVRPGSGAARCAGAAIRSAKPPSTHVGARQICARPARQGSQRPARHRVGHEHALAGVDAHAGGLVAERARIRPQRPVAVAPHLHVGAAGRRRLHLDDHLAVRLGHLLDAQVLGTVTGSRPSRDSTTHLQRLRPVAGGRARAPVCSSGRRCETSDRGSMRPPAISSSAARMSPGPAE